MPIMFLAIDLISVNACIANNNLFEEEERLEKKDF